LIPTSRLDPTALKFQPLIPAINAGSSTSVTRNYLATSPQSTRRNQGDVKIDHRLSDKNNLMGRVSISNQNIPNQGTFIYSPLVQFFNTRNVAIGDTHVFSPTVVNEIRLGYNRGNTSANATMEKQANDFTAKAGLAFGPIFGFPSLNWNTLGQSQGGATEFSSFSGAKTNYGFENTFQYADNLSIIRGDHTFKTGVDIRRFRFDRLLKRSGCGKLLLRRHLHRERQSRPAGWLALCRFSSRAAHRSDEFQRHRLFTTAGPVCRPVYPG
jgi:hypothetical protein